MTVPEGKSFPLAEVLSITTGKILVPACNLTKLVAHIMSCEESDISGGALTAYANDCRKAILAQRPYLEKVQTPPEVDIEAWLAEKANQFGEKIILASATAVRLREA